MKKKDLPNYEVTEALQSLPVNPEHQTLRIAKMSMFQTSTLDTPLSISQFHLSSTELNELTEELVQLGYGDTSTLKNLLHSRKE